MTGFDRTAALVLAAGLSTRFGQNNKLLQEFRGKPLAAHAADMLAGLPFAHLIAVCGPDEAALTALFSARGFTLAVNPRPQEGQAASIGIGMDVVAGKSPEAVLVALADMPLVSGAHVRALVGAGAGPMSMVASSGGAQPMPPALFGAGHFGTLRQLTGDSGARDLLKHAELIAPPAGQLVDFDTEADFARI